MTPETIALARDARDVEKLAEMKTTFDAKFRENMTKKTGKNVKILDNQKYEEKIKRLEELKANRQLKWAPEDYVLAKNHTVMDQILPDNTVAKTLVKIDPKTGERKRYVTLENLFDAIHEDHIKRTKHAGRLLTHKDICHRYANVTMEQIICYLELCETCALKKGKAKKGVVVKPIVSSQMGSRAQVPIVFSIFLIVVFFFLFLRQSSFFTMSH